MKSIMFAAVSAIFALLPATAQAFDWAVVAHVTNTEVSYAPTVLPFKIDTAGGTCAAGTFLSWDLYGTDAATKSLNAQAVLSVLMTAQASGHTVTVYGNNGSCTVDYLYLN